MSPDRAKNKVVIIVGATAVGKTRLAIRLAKRMNGEIISADSRYIYRGMDIGSAKPSLEERENIPHYVIDIANPDEVWSLAQYFSQSKQVISEVIAREKLPIVVGGTGQYIRALTEGWSVPVSEPNPKLRKILSDWGEEIGANTLYEKLAVLDPDACSFIYPTNVRRTIRALEVILFTGEKFSAQRKKTPPENDFWIIGLSRPRQELYERVDRRIEKMFEDGLIEEVATLMQKGYGPDLPSMSAIGYREVAQYLMGKMTLEEAKILMRRNTRKFIRRQNNWFKPEDPTIHWYSMENDPIDKICTDLQNNFIHGGAQNDK